MRFAVLAAAILAPVMVMATTVPAAAKTYTYEVVVEEWVETGASRFVSTALAEAENAAIASYGPFRVLDGGRAALVGVTDYRSPAQFAAMLAAYPGIDTIEFIECPGTYDDRANLQLGRMIRAAGVAAVVPTGGSVRSGAVELFLAGASRSIADGAEFAVHAWLDDRGMGAHDYAADSPEHAKYLAYYREMGMAADEAARFYAMTNSVPFEDALWLSGEEMRGWIGLDAPEPIRAPHQQLPRLAYLDLEPALN
ncbi:MAG TPA: hypothetical protein VLA45_18940 [Paracoccaceae bacterium]|nr:hypothetical protein [Paracoccaceae bacterium]